MIEDETTLEDALHAEEREARHADRAYWDPLRKVIENLRLNRRTP